MRAVQISWVGKETWFLVALTGLLVHYVASDGPEEAPPAAGDILRGHANLVEEVLFSPDGSRLMSSGWDRTVKIWAIQGSGPGWGRELGRIPHAHHVCSIAMSNDGELLATGGVGGVFVWSWREGVWELVEKSDGANPRCVAFSPDGGTLAFSADDGSIRFWDLRQRRQTRVFSGFGDELRRIAFSPDGRWICGLTYSGSFSVREVATAEAFAAGRFNSGVVQAFAFAPGGDALAIAERNGSSRSLCLWDLPSLKPRFRVDIGGNDVTVLGFCPAGQTLALADSAPSIRLWETASGSLRHCLREDVGWVKTLAFDPAGGRIAFGGSDGKVRFRNLPPTI